MNRSPTGPHAFNSHIAIRPDWLATSQEEPIEPAQLIVDAHHHLYDRPGTRYLLPELLSDLGEGHDIRATVFVQARAMHREGGPEAFKPVGETEFANGVAAMCASGAYGAVRACAGIVGYADLSLGHAIRPVLEAHMAAAGDRFRGIRQTLAWDRDSSLVNPAYPTNEEMMTTTEFRTGFALLAEYKLSFDAWLFFHQIPRLTDLARAFPEIPIALDHCGGILGLEGYNRTEVFEHWSSAMRELAACPNVTVKLGGLGMRLSGFGFEQRDQAPSSAELADAWRPWIDRCIELFGPARCMFESNFPVDKGSYGYGVGWNAMKRLAVGATAGEKNDLFWRTASRFYRLDVLSTGVTGESSEPGRRSAREAYDLSRFDGVFQQESVSRRLRCDTPAPFAAASGFWNAVLTTEHLSPRMKELVLLALHATATALNAEAIARHVERAEIAGASMQDVMDVLLSIVGVANHAVYSAIPILLEEIRAVLGEDAAALPELRPDLNAVREEFIRTRGFWNKDRDAIARLVPDYFKALSELSMAPWKYGTLTPKERELVYIAIDCSVTHSYGPGLRMHIKHALGHGATREEILAVFQLAAVTGLEGYILGAAAVREDPLSATHL